MARDNKLLAYLLAQGVLGTDKELEARRVYYNKLRSESRKRKQATSKSYKIWFSFEEVNALEARAHKLQVSVTKLIEQSALQNKTTSLPSQTVLNEILAKLRFVYSVEHLEDMQVPTITQERMNRLQTLYDELIKLLKSCS